MVRWPSCCKNSLRHGSIGHLGCRSCDLGTESVEIFDPLKIKLAKEIPDCRFRWNDVGLVAAVHDHIV